jgi:aspartate/methionine/tyrosine aminotransferase
MYPPTRYLEWVRRHYGKFRFDLATSGVTTVSLDEFGPVDPHTAPTRLDTTGWNRLRSAVAGYNDRPEGEVVATMGATHAIWLVYATLTEPGDEILVEDPAYEPLVRIAEGVGARVTRFVRSPEDGFALDPSHVARAMTSRTRVVVLTNLHNPSGHRASDEAIRATARVAAARDAFVVVDEVYAPFDSLVDASRVFGRSARRLAPNVVAVSSLTKCYGVGHERLGWLLGPPDVVARVQDALTSSLGFLPLPHAHRGICAFDRIDVLAALARDGLAERRERVRRWVASHRLTWSEPKEGIFAFVTMPNPTDLTPTIDTAVAERDVIVVPGAFFGIPNGFRIAWSQRSDALEEGLARLSAALELTPEG